MTMVGGAFGSPATRYSSLESPMVRKPEGARGVMGLLVIGAWPLAPSPLWGGGWAGGGVGGGGGGEGKFRNRVTSARPPPPTPPRKGEGSDRVYPPHFR